MPTLESLTTADLRGHLKAKSLKRASNYVARVQNPAREDQTLTAEVPGTRLYDVVVEVGPDGIDARCTCPYEWSGYCKHIGAVLLRWILAPEDFCLKGAEPLSKGHPIEVIEVEPSPTYHPEESPTWMTMIWGERQRVYHQQLETWLSQVKLQDLRRMAKNRGWRLKGTRKADVARQVAEYIADPDDIAQAIQSLDEKHLSALQVLLLLSGHSKVWAEDLEAAARTWGALGHHELASTSVHHLWETGLALPGYAKDEYDNTENFIPFALARHFPPLLEELATNLPARSAASRLCLADPYALVRTANQITLLLEQAPVQLRPPMPRPRLERVVSELAGWDYDPAELAQAQKSGRLNQRANLTLTLPPPGRSLPDEAIERLAPLAAGGEPIRASGEARLEFIFSLLAAVGVFQPGSPTTTWPEVKARFLRLDELAQRALLARIYLSMWNWSALWEVLRSVEPLRLVRACHYRYYEPVDLAQDLVGFRHMVLRALAALPDGEWVALEDLFQPLCVVWPRFDQTVRAPFYNVYSIPQRHRAGAWFLTRDGQPLRQDNVQDWDLAQGSFVRQLIAGPLYWLGLADIFLDGEDLVAFRLQGLADLYLERTESVPPPRHVAEQAPPPQAEAVNTDELCIIVRPSAVNAQAHSLLDKIARLNVAEPDRFVYQLDAQAAYEAFESGAALSEILDSWEQFLQVPMPGAIHSQLAAWWQAYGQVRLYSGLTVIEFGDDYALAEARAVTSLDKHLIAEITPRFVVIRPQAVAPLRAELEKAGYLPKQTDGI